MLKTIMKWTDSDGNEITLDSGGSGAAIKGCKITESVNSGEELTPGSCCSTCAEITIIAPGGGLRIAAGTGFTLYKQDDAGEEHEIGIFTAEKPTRTSANAYKLTAYDNVAKLDRDLSSNAVLRHLLEECSIPDSDCPTRRRLAGEVCLLCGVVFATPDFPYADLLVEPFDPVGCTGRQIMRWIAECAGCFCRANSEGRIELAQFGGDPVAILTPSKGRHYFSGTLSYEDYVVPAIGGVCYNQGGYLYDASKNITGEDTQNPFVISSGNKVLSKVYNSDETVKPVTLHNQLTAIGAYNPCKVSIPACTDIHAGDIVTVITSDDRDLRMLVMTKTTSGQRDTLECTGSSGRDSSAAANNVTTEQTAQRTVDRLSGQDILDKLGAVWTEVNGVRVLAKKEDISE